jgi:hypothetical protein
MGNQSEVVAARRTAQKNFRRWGESLDEQRHDLVQALQGFAYELVSATPANRDVLDPHGTVGVRVSTIVAGLMRLPPVFYATKSGEPWQPLPETPLRRQVAVAPPLDAAAMVSQSLDWLDVARAYLHATRHYASTPEDLNDRLAAAEEALKDAAALIAADASRG